MNWFKKMFNPSETKFQPQHQPPPEKEREEIRLDNSKFRYRLYIWGDHKSHENYQAVLDELYAEYSYVLLPVKIVQEEEGERYYPDRCILESDGMRALCVFSEEKSLIEFMNEPSTFIRTHIDGLARYCVHNNLGRVVINVGQKSQFELDRQRENFTTKDINESRNMTYCFPSEPLNVMLKIGLVKNFSLVRTIEEAYQFERIDGDKKSLAIGLKMSVNTPDSRNAVHDAIAREIDYDDQITGPLDVMILDEELLQTISAIPGAQFYKRAGET